MDAADFWQVIGNYNQHTVPYQIVLMLLIIASMILAYNKIYPAMLKAVLGLSNLFIGIVFFAVYGTEPIQTYFALPLYLAIGILFIWDGIKNKNDVFLGFKGMRLALFISVLLYPLASYALGHSFPRMAVYIMPCPIVSLSIVAYACYKKKNKALLALLTIWGLTGIKSFFLDVYEDIILLACGVFCFALFIGALRNRAETGLNRANG